MMNIKKFNEKYQSKGGFAKLIEFRQTLATLEFIANYFGVSKERVKQWMIELFGEKYDPRMQRREKVIQDMLEFAKEHTEKEFEEAFRLQNKDYFEETLRRAKGNNLF